MFTVRGPRQVGKTTLLKQLAQRLVVEAHWEPRRIVYYSLDLVDDPDTITELVREVKAAAPGVQEGRWCFLIDEITTVPRWRATIKYLWDNDIAGIRDDILVLSGSSATDLRREAERLPGRRGAGHDLVLLPLSFREFLGVVEPAILPNVTLKRPQDLLTADGEKAVRTAAFATDQLRVRLEQYAQVGGFPAAVADLLRSNGVTDQTMSALWSIVVGDIDRWDRNRVKALRLLGRVVESLGSPMSWHSLAEDMDVHSQTAEKYVNYLADAFLLFVVYFRERSGQSQPRKEKKVFGIDPLILRIPHHVEGSALPQLPAVVEDLVGAALLRLCERDLAEAFRDPQSLCYWKSSRQKEIDFLAGYRPHEFAVEVRYQRRVKPADTLGIRNGPLKRGTVLSMNDLVWDSDVPIVPAPVALALFDA